MEEGQLTIPDFDWFRLRNYQEYFVDKVVNSKRGILTLGMGYGKTAIVIKALNRLHKSKPDLKILVVAPKRVAEYVWVEELTKWGKYHNLTYSLIAGTAQVRRLMAGLNSTIHIISRDNVQWYVDEIGGANKYDVVVVDEISSFKSHKTKRFKSLRQLTAKAEYVIGMTGTPNPNSYVDLWAQAFLIDGGQRLGRYVSHYLKSFFVPTKFVNGFAVQHYCGPEMQKVIGNKLKDIMWGLADDVVLDIPEVSIIDVEVDHGPEVLAEYKDFEKSRYYKLKESGYENVALNAGTMVSKLIQFSGGSLYSADRTNNHSNADGSRSVREYEVLSDAKVEALVELIEEANGSPVLVAYAFRSELDRLRKRLSATFKVGVYSDKDCVARWNAGEYEVLLAHPASFGHGLNLQHGGHICVWFGPTYSYELYTQFNKRLHRPGQKHPVVIYRLVSKGMVDSHIYNVALKRKGDEMGGLMEILKVLEEEYA